MCYRWNYKRSIDMLRYRWGSDDVTMRSDDIPMGSDEIPMGMMMYRWWCWDRVELWWQTDELVIWWHIDGGDEMPMGYDALPMGILRYRCWGGRPEISMRYQWHDVRRGFVDLYRAKREAKSCLTTSASLRAETKYFRLPPRASQIEPRYYF